MIEELAVQDLENVTTVITDYVIDKILNLIPLLTTAIKPSRQQICLRAGYLQRQHMTT
jgi:hypothetical protein